MAGYRRYHLNVLGPFYVVDGCCMMCGVPYDTEAPALFGVDGEEHCYVKKQPSTPEELESMLNAIRVAEAKCIRYGGHDPSVLAALEDAGEADVCDHGKLE